MPREPKPIKGRFQYSMNWKKSTFKIIDTHTGRTITLREWNVIELSNLLPRLILDFVMKKGNIKDADGKIYTKEELIKALKQNERAKKTDDSQFEAHPDSDEPKIPSPKE